MLCQQDITDQGKDRKGHLGGCLRCWDGRSLGWHLGGRGAGWVVQVGGRVEEVGGRVEEVGGRMEEVGGREVGIGVEGREGAEWGGGGRGAGILVGGVVGRVVGVGGREGV